MFEIIVSNRARKGAKKSPKELKEKIVELLDVLENEPVPADKYDVKKLKGLTNTYRIRFGDWRIVYKVEFAEIRITIVKIEKRSRVYK